MSKFSALVASEKEVIFVECAVNRIIGFNR